MLIAGVSLAALTGGYFYLRRQNPIEGPNAAKQAVSEAVGAAAKPAFTGGDQGFISLVLDKTEIVNHNTKRLTFKLPEPDMVSGMPVASAVITKYKGPEMEKPVIRPYTPVSDVGTCIVSSCSGEMLTSEQTRRAPSSSSSSAMRTALCRTTSTTWLRVSVWKLRALSPSTSGRPTSSMHHWTL